MCTQILLKAKEALEITEQAYFPFYKLKMGPETRIAYFPWGYKLV